MDSNLAEMCDTYVRFLEESLRYTLEKSHDKSRLEVSKYWSSGEIHSNSLLTCDFDTDKIT